MIRFDVAHPTLKLAVVFAQGVRCEPSQEELIARMQSAEARLRVDSSLFSEDVRAAIRNVLRTGGYKPTGRGKPASEFLLGVATAQGLPRVNNLVDINNLVSVTTALPISMFDADHLGIPASVRLGRVGEAYVFNASGQTMDIAGIPVICRSASDEPVGNAVKDSMLAKVGPDTRAVLAVIYGCTALTPGYLEAAASELVKLLKKHAAAQVADVAVLPH